MDCEILMRTVDQHHRHHGRHGGWLRCCCQPQRSPFRAPGSMSLLLRVTVLIAILGSVPLRVEAIDQQDNTSDTPNDAVGIIQNHESSHNNDNDNKSNMTTANTILDGMASDAPAVPTTTDGQPTVSQLANNGIQDLRDSNNTNNTNNTHGKGGGDSRGQRNETIPPKQTPLTTPKTTTTTPTTTTTTTTTTTRTSSSNTGTNITKAKKINKPCHKKKCAATRQTMGNLPETTETAVDKNTAQHATTALPTLIQDNNDDDHHHHHHRSNKTQQTRNAIKDTLSKILQQNTTTPTKLRIPSPRNVVSYAFQHQWQCTLLLATVAFRKEIALFFKHVVWRFLTVPVYDPQSNKVIRIRRVINPTIILKTIVVIDLLRRYYRVRSSSSRGHSNTSSSSTATSTTTATTSSNNTNTIGNDPNDPDTSNAPSWSPLATALLLFIGRTTNPILGVLLSRLLSSTTHVAYLPPTRQHYTFERINDRYSKDQAAFYKATGMTTSNRDTTGRRNLTHPIWDWILPNTKDATALSPRTTDYSNETVIVLDWTDLDTAVRHMDVLRDQVTYLIQCVPTSSEIVVVLESPGGSAADYSLASQQLLRLRKQGYTLTICVDKVAASGGYMIACTASPGRLLAAPFAMLGSIGVLGQTFNIHKTLEGWGVKPLVFRGGKHKAPVGLVGEITDEGIAKVQQMIDKTHEAFKRHVVTCRPSLSIRMDELASGEVWLGQDAVLVDLVDRIITSDEYIGKRVQTGARVLKLMQLIRPRYPFQSPKASSELSAYEYEQNALQTKHLARWWEMAWKAIGSFTGIDDRGMNSLTRVSEIQQKSSVLSNL